MEELEKLVKDMDEKEDERRAGGLLVSFETGAKEATRARDLEEVNASIEDCMKELSREQVAVDERGPHANGCRAVGQLGTCSPSGRNSPPPGKPNAFACYMPHTRGPRK
jgi:hypothetical protein